MVFQHFGGNTNIDEKSQKFIEGTISCTNIHSPTEQTSYDYQGDQFSPTFNKIKMTDDTKINCPSKTSAIPISPNMGSFCPPSLGSHPQGLPPQPYQPHWNQSGPGPGFVPPLAGYGQPPNFMQPQQFSSDPNLYRNQINHSVPPNMPPRHPLPHHPNGGTPPMNNPRFSPSSTVGSSFPPAPPGCTSPTVDHITQSSQHWPPPASELPPNHIGNIPPTTKDNFEQLSRANIPGDIHQIPTSVVSPDNNKAYARSPFLNNPEDHHNERVGHDSSKGSNSSSILPATTSPSSAPLCAGCKLRIMDKFVLEVVDAKWHSTCLKCVECGVELENQMACFERDSQFFCKEHYVR